MTTNYTESFSRTLQVVFIHLILFICFSVFLNLLIYGNLAIDWAQFIQWDTGWYISIKEHGYIFTEGSQNNTGFFPLFPLLWKALAIGTAGICLLNFSIFVLSFYLIVCFFNPQKKTQYLFLSIPCFFFFLVPYSESLFFLFSTLILIGLKKDNRLLTIAAFLLAIFTRSAGTIFVPALVISFFLLRNKKNVKKTFNDYFLYVIACIVGTTLVIYFQYLQTNVWFAATKTHKYWEHYLRMPTLPLRSWGREEITRLDGIGMLVGIIAASILFFLFISKIKRTYTEEKKHYIFSLLYLAGVTLSLLLFQGGDVHSLNRYVFATPFYLLLLLEFEKSIFSIREITVAFLLLTTYWLGFLNYWNTIIFLSYVLLSLFLVSFLLIHNPIKKIGDSSFLLVYTGSTLSQAYFFVRFLHGGWVG